MLRLAASLVVIAAVLAIGLDGGVRHARALSDVDGDAIEDDVDNCLVFENSDQTNTDAANDVGDVFPMGDELGDQCDGDDDNDAYADAQEESAGSNPLDPLSVPPAFLPEFNVGFTSGTTQPEIDDVLLRLESSITSQLLDGSYIVETASSLGVLPTLYRLRREPVVEFAQVDVLVEVQDHLTEPDDPDFRSNPADPANPTRDQYQWSLNNTGGEIMRNVEGDFVRGRIDADIDAPQAWEHATDCSSIVVAVVEDGFDTTHRDFAGNLWVNPGEDGLDGAGNDKRTNGLDDDGDGYVDNVNGANIAAKNGTLNANGHATGVAGIIGARGDNTTDISGVCWRVQLMSLQARTATQVRDAIDLAILLRGRGVNIRVINNSVGDPDFDARWLAAIRRARDAGIVVVTPAGQTPTATNKRDIDSPVDGRNHALYKNKGDAGCAPEPAPCVDAGDIRLTGVQVGAASFPAGSVVQAGDPDVKRKLEPFAAGEKHTGLAGSDYDESQEIYRDNDNSGKVSGTAGKRDVRVTDVTRGNNQYQSGSPVKGPPGADADVGEDLQPFKPDELHTGAGLLPGQTGFYPCGYDVYTNICVTSSTNTDRKRTTHNWGIRSVELAAPGEAVLTLAPGNALQTVTGTSFAAPHVSGALAHCMTLFPPHPGETDRDYAIRNALTIRIDVDPRPGIRGFVNAGQDHDARLRMCMGDDFGDADDPFTAAKKYPTRRDSDGARHEDIGEEWLGDNAGEVRPPGASRNHRGEVSGEFDAIVPDWALQIPYDVDRRPNLQPAEFKAREGNDFPKDGPPLDDGVKFKQLFEPGQQGAEVEFQVCMDNARIVDVEAGRFGPAAPVALPALGGDKRIYVNGFIDFDRDGTWDQANEWIATAQYRPPLPGEWPATGAGYNGIDCSGFMKVTFNVPATARIPQAWIRFRLDYGQNLRLRAGPATTPQAYWVCTHAPNPAAPGKVMPNATCQKNVAGFTTPADSPPDRYERGFLGFPPDLNRTRFLAEYGEVEDYHRQVYIRKHRRFSRTTDNYDLLDNLWLCYPDDNSSNDPDCDGPGEGSLGIVKEAVNVYTGDENGDTIEDGLGAYEFLVEYDNFVIQSVNVCDIVFSDQAAGNGAGRPGRGPVDEVDSSSPANPDCTPDVNSIAGGTCSMSLVLENVVRFGCTTTGQNPGPTGDFDLASLVLIPHPDLTNDLFPGNENGVVTVVKDNGCELVDVFGHPVIGSVNGGLTPACEDLAVTVRILEGDLDLDCDVDVTDAQIISFRFGSFFGSLLYIKWYDLEPALHDLDIDIKDMQKVFGRDGSTCQEPIPAQPPLPPPVPFG